MTRQTANYLKVLAAGAIGGLSLLASLRDNSQNIYSPLDKATLDQVSPEITECFESFKAQILANGNHLKSASMQSNTTDCSATSTDNNGWAIEITTKLPSGKILKINTVPDEFNPYLIGVSRELGEEKVATVGVGYSPNYLAIVERAIRYNINGQNNIGPQ